MDEYSILLCNLFHSFGLNANSHLSSENLLDLSFAHHMAETKPMMPQTTFFVPSYFRTYIQTLPTRTTAEATESKKQILYFAGEIFCSVREVLAIAVYIRYEKNCRGLWDVTTVTVCSGPFRRFVSNHITSLLPQSLCLRICDKQSRPVWAHLASRRFIRFRVRYARLILKSNCG